MRKSNLDGLLVPGSERLVDRKLAKLLGTCQSAICEALIQLELEGQRQQEPNSATFVTHFSQCDLENTIALGRARRIRCGRGRPAIDQSGHSTA